MKSIILDDDHLYRLINKFSQFRLESGVLQTALALTEELPLPKVKCDAKSFNEADREWRSSGSRSEEEKAAIRKCVEFSNLALDETDEWGSQEEVLLALFVMARNADDENSQVLIIRKMAEEVILK